jgi:hypothetical protein
VTLIPGELTGSGSGEYADGWLLDLEDMETILVAPDPHDAAGELDRTGELERNPWGVWAGAGQGRLFSMRDLPLLAVECGVVHRRGGWEGGLSLAWQRFGADLLREDTSTVRLDLGRIFRVGVEVNSHRWLVAGQPVASQLQGALDGALTIRLGQDLEGQVTFWLYQADSPIWHGRNGRHHLLAAKIMGSGYGLAVRCDQRADGVPVMSLEILVRLVPGCGFGFRADPGTGSLGGTIAVQLGIPWLRTSHIVHPALGATHRFHLGAGDPAASAW